VLSYYLKKKLNVMKIYVDADACPNQIKELLYKASQRTKLELILVSNQYLHTPASALIKTVRVGHGFDVADNYIVDNLVQADIVITADIPLASSVIEKNAIAINPRGELYTKENIKQRLLMRNIMSDLRDSGVQTGGPKSLHQRDIRAFANTLDGLLAKLLKR
jgi:uncharacterized protein YaiI (UPF0178 family)